MKVIFLMGCLKVKELIYGVMAKNTLELGIGIQEKVLVF